MVNLLLTNHRLAPSVESQPVVCIRRWRIVATANGEEYLTGLLENGYTWRVTSPVVEFKASARRITTSSGRQYELIGLPAVDLADVTVITAQLLINGLADTENTSEIYWQAMANAIH